MNFKDIIKESVLENFTGNITPARVVVVLSVALVLGIYIFIAYRVAINNEFYSKEFNKTLALMSVTTAAIVLAIQSNLVISLGMVGALSIVRFRTAIKSPMDLFFLFWSISVGIISGAGLYLLACVTCLVITLLLVVLNYMNSPAGTSLLVIQCDGAETAYRAENLVKQNCKFSRLKNKTVSSGCTELILEIKVTDTRMLETALSDMKEIRKFAFMNYDRETRI